MNMKRILLSLSIITFIFSAVILLLSDLPTKKDEHWMAFSDGAVEIHLLQGRDLDFSGDYFAVLPYDEKRPVFGKRMLTTDQRNEFFDHWHSIDIDNGKASLGHFPIYE